MRSALLLSGGMDSVSIAYWKRPDFAITIDYGQTPAPGEIRAAAAVCAELGIEHSVLTVDVSELGSGDLVGTAPSDAAPASEWWPYRNQLLLTLAGMACFKQGIAKLMIGALRTDGFHVDGTKEFVQQINQLFGMQEGEMLVEAPAIKLDAVELVLVSEIPMSILSWAHSCHTSELACGFCRGCRKHFETMKALDGLQY